MEKVEQTRLEKINLATAKHVQDYLEQLANEEIDLDDLLSLVYASLIVSILLGCSPEELIEDVKISVEKMVKMADEENG